MEIDTDDLWQFYQENRAAYEYVIDRLEMTREAIQAAPSELRQHVLFMADTYGIITAMTKVEAHDLAFAGVAKNPLDPDKIKDVLSTTRARASGDHAVMFHNNKSDYIRHNMDNVDYAKQAELFAEERWDELHEMKVDEVKGLASTKAAFSMAMCGVTEQACLDTNMIQMFGLDHDDVGTSTSEEYGEYVDEAMSKTPRLDDELDPYPWQWVCWDYFRDSAVTVHDSWFVAIGDTLDEPRITT